MIVLERKTQIYNVLAGKPYEPNNFEAVMETSISVTVRWKAGFAAGYEPQTFKLEYKEKNKSGKIVYFLLVILIIMENTVV